MVSTSNRISVAARALLVLLVLLIAPAQSKTKNMEINGHQYNEQQQRQYESETHPARNTGAVENVPLDVIESMDPKLIDFVVGGFPKCGTTYLQNKVLYESKRVFIPHRETHFLANDKYEEFKDEFANATEVGEETNFKPLVTGYKSPFELGHQKSLRNLQTLFPDVRMVITLRHPVLQFESLYNYKLRKLPELIPPVDEFVGNCLEQCPSSSSLVSSPSGAVDTIVTRKSSQRCLKGVTFCTGQTNFHQYLSRLGLTPMNTPEELDLLDHHQMSIHPFAGWRREFTNISGSDEESKKEHSFIRVPANRREDIISSGNNNTNSSNNKGRLFLIEIGQFDNRVNQSMADDVNSDLENFLGLDTGDLPRAPPRNGDKKPSVEYEYPLGREEQKLDICLDRYKPLREVLLEASQKSSKWIMEYLLHPSNRDVVIVSNIEIFERMLEKWKIDPCSNEDENLE